MDKKKVLEYDSTNIINRKFNKSFVFIIFKNTKIFYLNNFILFFDIN